MGTGERGLRWLKIHLANLYGYDKATFDERVIWVDQRIEQIMASCVLLPIALLLELNRPCIQREEPTRSLRN